MKTLNGHFDGKVVVLDEPASLPLNTKVTIFAPELGEDDLPVARFAQLAEPVFQKIWDNPLDAEYDRL